MSAPNFSERQIKLSREPTPMLYGNPATVDGWCSLVEHERSTALEILGSYRVEVALWYRGLGLMLDGFPGEWLIPEEEPTNQATMTRAHLLGLELSSAKAALDMTLAGYYSIAMASIRHMLEATAQSMYLMLFPDAHVDWEPEGHGPGMWKLIDQIKKELKKQGADDVNRYEALYESWKLMCKGSHPSGAGLLQVIAQEGDERNIVGSVFRPEFVDVIFDHGLWAMVMVLTTFPSLKVMDDGWRQRFNKWLDDRQAWRQEMRRKMNMDSDIGEGAIISSDLKI